MMVPEDDVTNKSDEDLCTSLENLLKDINVRKVFAALRIEQEIQRREFEREHESALSEEMRVKYS